MPVHIGQDKIKESPKPNTSWENGLADFPALSFLKDSKNRRHISRPREVVDARNDIPIVMMEQEIMEAINEHSTVIIRGETGCGKTTQVPQFLYEVGIGSSGCPLGSGIIGVTQPRCIAVTATAKRVAYELGLQLGEEVGFQYRYDKKIGESCSIKFMTDGILLREIQGDFYLKRYSVIILDEVHERSLCTETLIGMLSAIIGVRQKLYEDQQKKLRRGLSIVREKRIFPLKLVLMSATMPVEDFRKMFPDPPQVINVSSRQFKVSTQFSATTEGHYINEAYKKVLEIHKTLPHGGILVFLTGYREIEELCQKLRRHSGKLIKTSLGSCATEGLEINSVEEINMKKEMEAYDSNGNSAFHQTDGFSYNDEDHCEIDEYELDSIYDAETESELETIGDDRDSLCEDKPEVDGNVAQALGENLTIASLKASFEALARKSSSDSTSACREPISCTLDSCSNQSNHSCSLGTKGGVEDPGKLGSLHVLPLYSMLPAAAQRHVFEKVKEGERLVVVATNVAETSLTIPGIKYVVDTGKVKVKDYNFSNGMETYKVQWISKASAIQREGRAGRTGPGHCFRLYSSAIYDNEFLDCSESEISKVPVDGVLLLMKAMKIPVSKFQFPTPPNGDTIDEAEDRLKLLKALDSNGEVTPLGKAMACYPISPRQSKMLLTVIEILNMKQSYSRANLVLAYAVAAAAALSVSNPFDSQFEDSHIKNFDLGQNGSYSAPVNSEYMDQQEILIRRKKLKVSSEKFHSSSSDALSRAYALRGYELSKSQMGFCKENALHPETMEEISKLRKQLLKLVFNPNGVSGGVKEFSWIYGSQKDVETVWRDDEKLLSVNEEELLRQAICAGWIDRVAKRIEGSAYQACMVKETVFLHWQSPVSKIAPEFLVYSELIQTKKPFMYGITCVSPDWLVKYGLLAMYDRRLCTFSKETPPYYDRQTDKLLYSVTPTFGRVQRWELPQHSLPISNFDHTGAVQAFAFALLDGKVLHCLRPVRESMAERPHTVLRPEAAGRERVHNLLAKLGKKKIVSRAMLIEVWKENPTELYSEIRSWFKESFHQKFREIWVKMLYEALF
ncbi:hypothetical protein ABKV19_010563 [Rosa sericea]